MRAPFIQTSWVGAPGTIRTCDLRFRKGVEPNAPERAEMQGREEHAASAVVLDAPEGSRRAPECTVQYDNRVPDAATYEQVNALATGALGALDAGNVPACRVLLLMLLSRG